MDKVSQISSNHLPSGGSLCCLAIGYSARALAEALCDAGFRVIAADAFGDKDLADSAEVPQIISQWGAPAVEKNLQTEHWKLYSGLANETKPDFRIPVFPSGGCENWPELLEFFEKHPKFRLLGPGTAQLNQLRNPEIWQKACIGSGLAFPPSIFPNCDQTRARQPDDLDPGPSYDGIALGPTFQDTDVDTRWLLKKRASGGGLGVQVADLAISTKVPRGHYWQQFVPGRCLGVSLLVQQTGANTNVQIIGVTESWNCQDWPADSEFIYRGSFGPIELTTVQRTAVEHFVLKLISHSDSVQQVRQSQNGPQSNGAEVRVDRWNGWLQVDLIERNDGQLFLLEVNPRWTSGMEVLLVSGQANMAALHAKANGIDLKATRCEPQTPSFWVGKAIYYAAHPIHIDEIVLAKLHQLAGHGFSDIPSSRMLGQSIKPGGPVLTVSAIIDRSTSSLGEQMLQKSEVEASARQRVLDLLHKKRTQLDALLGITSSTLWGQ